MADIVEFNQFSRVDSIGLIRLCNTATLDVNLFIFFFLLNICCTWNVWSNKTQDANEDECC